MCATVQADASQAMRQIHETMEAGILSMVDAKEKLDESLAAALEDREILE
jgi:hypothetical protein